MLRLDQGTTRVWLKDHVNHLSISKCMGYKSSACGGSLCNIYAEDYYDAPTRVGKSKNILFSKYFQKTNCQKINRNPKILSIILSLNTFDDPIKSKRPLMIDRYYPKRNITHICTLNQTTSEQRTSHTANTDSQKCTNISADGCYEIQGNVSAKCSMLPECENNLHVLDHPTPLLESRADNDNMLFIYIILQGGTISKYGNVRAGDIEITYQYCVAVEDDLQSDDMPTYKKVFVASKIWGGGYFHVNIEIVPRIFPYLQLLKRHPEIRIHAFANLKRYLSLLGVKPDRVVSGAMKANMIYFPMGWDVTHPKALQLLHHHYAKYLMETHRVTIPKYASKLAKEASNQENRNSAWSNHTNSYANSSNIQVNPKNSWSLPISTMVHPNAIVLIERRSKRRRWLAQHTQIKALLTRIANDYSMMFEVFSDVPLPTLTQTISMFARARLVVAPHGAGTCIFA